jgi:hypothetical protein
MGDVEPFYRNHGSDVMPDYRTYGTADCPGVDNTTNLNHFPIINTLLSIPFSLLHTLPRLAAMRPMSLHQIKLMAMAGLIVNLWDWDPSGNTVHESVKIRFQKTAANQYEPTRNPKPYNITHPSRNDTTFQTTAVVNTHGISVSRHPIQALHQDTCTVQFSPSEILYGTTPFLSFDKSGILLTTRNEGSVEIEEARYTKRGTNVDAHCHKRHDDK